MTEKTTLRGEVTRYLIQLTEAQRLESDCALQQKFLSLPQLDRVERVLLYWSMGNEIDTLPILEQLLSRGKQVLLPRCLPGGAMETRLYVPGRLVPHRWGMQEPAMDCPLLEPELALIPALCYDKNGYRLGWGGGYYDRWLARTKTHTVGLCRHALLKAHLPRESWDRRVELVLTEQAAFECKE